jgi:hypothetical protein
LSRAGVGKGFLVYRTLSGQRDNGHTSGKAHLPFQHPLPYKAQGGWGSWPGVDAFGLWGRPGWEKPYS